jgi:hypothetical protein
MQTANLERTLRPLFPLQSTETKGSYTHAGSRGHAKQSKCCAHRKAGSDFWVAVRHILKTAHPVSHTMIGERSELHLLARYSIGLEFAERKKVSNSIVLTGNFCQFDKSSVHLTPAVSDSPLAVSFA